MASSHATSPDTIINLKVSHDGVIKKLKLPLRDLGASTLENKLRDLLQIYEKPSVFERYSDSGARYIVLDPNDVAVFKQLYRAAKAKQKLKLRVTSIDKPEIEEQEQEQEQKPDPEPEPEPKLVPRPVTVEDVPEASEPKPTAEHIEDATAPSTSTTALVPAGDTPVVGTTIADAKDLLARATETHEQFIASLRQRGVDRTAKDFEDLLECLDAKKGITKQPLNTSAEIQPAPTPQPVRTCMMQFDIPKPIPPQSPAAAAPRPPFAVYCNSCDKTIPDAHYHCSTCDDGDFDLCQSCVDMGISCYGDDHWLIKRLVRGGVIVNSTTERKAPKSLSQARRQPEPQPAPNARVVPVFRNYVYQNVRTCNNCVQELPEHEFLHCMTCYDFDLCKSCFVKDQHGHHPKHGFVPAADGTVVDKEISSLLAPGRNQRHNAICDGCDKFIRGVRHKCLDCPDWDYCSECAVNAPFVHPNHRFVPIYDPLRDNRVQIVSRPVHYGIYCDGPLCCQSGNPPRFICGDRFKCAVCNDTDFCANCEASPANTHNKTHPLLKFKTPVRNVNVVTTGEHEDGKKMPTMGDRPRPSRTSSRATETTSEKQKIGPSSVQTVVDVEPVAVPPPVVEKTEKVAQPVVGKEPPTDELVAVYERDTIPDGTVMPPNHIFEQTWVLRNAGTAPWPAGTSVKYVGGDYMGHIDPNHPAGVKDLVSCSESTICYQPLAPGQEFPFTVLLRTPNHDGRVISYWRLTTDDGKKFGHRLWCDVEVKAPPPATSLEQELAQAEKEVDVAKEEPTEKPKEESRSVRTEESQMIFPRLEKESPVASVHEDAQTRTDASIPVVETESEDFEDCNEDDEWDESEDGFMTDEEYDILDASDEEYLEDEQKKQLKK